MSSWAYLNFLQSYYQKTWFAIASQSELPFIDVDKMHAFADMQRGVHGMYPLRSDSDFWYDSAFCRRNLFRQFI